MEEEQKPEEGLDGLPADPEVPAEALPEVEVAPERPLSRRRQNRVAAMQFLYMVEINPPVDLPGTLRQFFENQDHPRAYYAFAEELIWGFMEHREAVDACIRSLTTNWSFVRIAKVDLAILRLALFELMHRTDIPPIVSINEAIDLSKAFSGPDSRRFINGILDKFKENLQRPLRTGD